jgi:hypothetical protein
MLVVSPFVVADVPMPKSEDPPAPAAKSADDLEKLREQIARDMQAVEKKLNEQDTGDGTRALQNQILANIDRLLDRAKNPPPSPESPPTGGASQDKESSPMNPAAQNRGQPRADSTKSRRERRESLRRQQEQARGKGRPGETAGPPIPKKSRTASSGDVPPSGRMQARTASADSLADVVKDIWGQLPDTLRQEVDHYYREQFMPRYRDLLQQYYLRLSETERRPREMKP